MNPAPAPANPAASGWKLRALPGFAGLVGPIWTRKEEDGWAYGLLATKAHLNPAGLVHGGLLSTLIDHGLSAIAWEAMGRKACVTIHLDTQFLSSVREGDFLEARGRVARTRSNLVFMQGAISVGRADALIASAVMKVIGPSPGV